MAKDTRADGAIRVGTVSEWKKPDNTRAPRRCKIRTVEGRSEWIKVWPERTTGWNNKTPIKSANEALAALGTLCNAEDAPTVLINGYEQKDEYGITFYAEGEILAPAPEGSTSVFLLENQPGSGKGATSADLAELVAAINWNTAVNAAAGAVDMDQAEARFDFIAKMQAGAPAAAATVEVEAVPEVEF